MRRFIVAVASTLPLMTGLAFASEVVQIAPFAPEILVPRPAEDEVNRLAVFEIGAGAVLGVIAANVVSGGMITPILMGASFGMPASAAAAAGPVVQATSATMVAAHAGILVVGAAIGAAVGNWLFGTSS